MARYRLTAALLGVSIAIAVAATANAATAPTRGADQPFTFVVPSGLEALPDGYFVPASDAFPGAYHVGYRSSRFPGATVVVSMVPDSPGGATLDAVVANLPPPPGFSPLGAAPQHATLGGLPAVRWESIGPPLGGRLHMLEIAALDGDALYTITFTAADADFADFLAQATAVADSFAVVSKTPTVPNATNAGGRYSDTEGRFSFAVPTGWTAAASADDPVVVSLRSNQPPADASVAAVTFDEGSVSLDEYVAAQRDAVAEEYPDQQQIARTRTVLGGEQAVRAEYNVTRAGVPTRIVHIIAIHADVGYVVEFVVATADASSIGAPIATMIDSWRFQ